MPFALPSSIAYELRLDFIAAIFGHTTRFSLEAFIDRKKKAIITRFATNKPPKPPWFLAS